ncbi:MAG: helix-turn-helix domain-containing protein [Nitrospirae bacterium]|nr:helix-turn-helix domain-containing protein [Nitrospirota bacterium]
MKRLPAQASGSPAHQRSGQILYVSAAAVLLACSEKAIRAKVARQLLPHRRLGGRVIFLRNELETFLSELPGTSVAEAQANLALRSGEEGPR